jgi:ubiquinol-cytochrome c reductase cytochrome c subunit
MCDVRAGVFVIQAALVAIILALCSGQHAVAQAPAAAVDTAPEGNAASGEKLYVDRACWQCHGLAAQGGGIAGPRLAGRVTVWAAFAGYVRQPAEEMIPYTAKVLPDPELADIFAWLQSLPPPPAVDSLPVLSPAAR